MGGVSTQLESLRRYVAQQPTTPPRPPTGGGARVVVVGSGKGGVGTSILAALLALGGAARGADTLLVDGDATFGSLHLLLGAEPGPGLAGLRGGAGTPEELLVHLSDRLHLLPAGETGETIPTVERQALFRRVSGLYPRYDFVVVDGGSRLDSVLAACAAGAVRVLIASTVERIALTATYALAKVLADKNPGLPVELLLNRTEQKVADPAADEVRSALKHFLRRTIGYAGWIPDDECVRAALEAGMDLQDAAVGSPAAARLELVAANLLTQLTAAPRSERLHLPRRS
jgi:MinD-like ATPase involved in chromosome partitioning or flagellar assembly